MEFTPQLICNDGKKKKKMKCGEIPIIRFERTLCSCFVYQCDQMGPGIQILQFNY